MTLVNLHFAKRLKESSGKRKQPLFFLKKVKKVIFCKNLGPVYKREANPCARVALASAIKIAWVCKRISQVLVNLLPGSV